MNRLRAFPAQLFLLTVLPLTLLLAAIAFNLRRWARLAPA